MPTPNPSARQRFNALVSEAVRYFATHGYVSDDVVEAWAQRLEVAARGAMVDPRTMSSLMTGHLQAVYNRVQSKYKKKPPVFDKVIKAQGFTPEHWAAMARVVPKLQKDLDARIAASAQLIKINREEAIAQTMRRFRGWASSVPEGGTAAGIGDPQADIRKPLQRLPFVARRVLTDQGHKLNSSLNATIAENSGALAGIWNSNWRQKNYNFREDHKERDKKIYTIKGNWALEKGFMKVGPDGYTDDITMPGEEVYCRCWYTYIYNLDSLPDEMLTVKGRQALEDLNKVA